MRGKAAAYILCVVCVILAVLLLIGVIGLMVSGIAFAVALAALGVVSRGFKRQ